MKKTMRIGMAGLTTLAALLLGSTLLQAEEVSLEQTEKNWKRHCALCHGKNGDGQTRVGKKLKVRDYTKPEVQAQLEDEAMYQAIAKGYKVDGDEVMEGYANKLSEAEMQALVTYIRDMKAE